MATPVIIGDGFGTGNKAHVHRVNKNSPHMGLITLQERFLKFNPEFHPFLHPTLGRSMNQPVIFGTAGSVIHDGGTTTEADSGTADTNTLNHVIQAGQNFNTTCVVGMFVTGTNTGHITAVNSDTDITCDADICPNGNEAYTIDPVWTGTAIQGTWNFADSGKITLSSGVDGDQASIAAVAAAAYSGSNFTAFTGKVDLDTYNETNNSILIQFSNGGVSVGSQVNLNDFIQAGDFSEQTFAIPVDNLGIAAETFDSVDFVFTRSGGAQGAFKLDDLRLEVSGEPLEFKATTPIGTRYHIDQLRFIFVDAISTTLADATMPNLSYDKILGVTKLTNGIIFKRVQNGVTNFSVTLKQLGDFLGTGSNITNVISDGTNTMLTLEVDFNEPIILEGGGAENDENYVSLTISDDLSGLKEFTAATRGAVEV